MSQDERERIIAALEACSRANAERGFTPLPLAEITTPPPFEREEREERKDNEKRHLAD